MIRLYKIASLLLLIPLLIISCKSKPTIDTPIVANSFHDMIIKIDSTCKNINQTDCQHIWALITLNLPTVKSLNYTLNKEEESIAYNLFTKLNSKTPRELLQIYKSDMMSIIQQDIEKDKQIVADLDEVMSIYESTSKYLKNFTVNGVKNSFLKSSANVMWNIYNNSKFNIKQIVGYVNYYDGNKLIFKSSDFTHKFTPELISGERLTILVNVEIDSNIIDRIRAVDKPKVIIKFKSMGVNSATVNSLIFEIPESYNKMREMLKRSEALYKQRINLINSIHTE